MRDLNRLAELARRNGAHEREPLPKMGPPPPLSMATSQNDMQDARRDLVLQRQASRYYNDPSKQRRNMFKSKSKKAMLSDTTSWKFTPAERWAKIDEHIRQRSHVNMALALLLTDAEQKLDVNATYTSDQNGDSIQTNNQNGWLNFVAELNSVDYVRLLCAFGANEQSKNAAFARAVEQQSWTSAHELLRNNANPNVIGIEKFINAISEQDMEAIELLLTSIIPVDATFLNQGLVTAAWTGNLDIIALLIAHGAHTDYNEGQALSTAIVAGRRNAAATILLNLGYSNLDSSISLYNATAAACHHVEDPSERLKLLEMLFSAGANGNTIELQEQLLRAAALDHREMVELLIGNGTSVNRNNAESLHIAIKNENLNIAMSLLRGDISQSNASIALEDASTLQDTNQYEKLVSALIEKGVHPTALHKALTEAVKKNCTTVLLQLLISHGAIIIDAQCVRTVLQRNNIGYLTVLLSAPCKPDELCQSLPDAMKIRDRSDRFEIIRVLLDKGVSGRELHIALQTVAQDATNATDFKLMELLVRNNASVDFARGHCVCIAAQNENEEALDILAGGEPSKETATAALAVLPVTFTNPDPSMYEKCIRMMQLLLEKGATGQPASQLLIKATREDSRRKAFRLLLQYKADANYDSGSAVEEALKHSNSTILRQICQQLPLVKSTFAAQLPNALEPTGFDLEKVTILVKWAAHYGFNDALDVPLILEVQRHGSRKEVIRLLLDNGANVDFRNGEALVMSVWNGDIETTRIFLSNRPLSKNVARAFPATLNIKSPQLKYEFMQALLSSGDPNMGNEALIQVSREAIPDDLSLVELLLQNNVSPDYQSGAAVVEAVRSNNKPLLELFVRTGLKSETLSRTFDVIREMKYTKTQRNPLLETVLASGVDSLNTGQALIEAVERDPADIETSTLLLQYNAPVDTDDGRALQTVAAAGSYELLTLFLARNPNQWSRDNAFRAAMLSSLPGDIKTTIYRILLCTGIAANLITAALLDSTRQLPLEKPLLELLTSFGASLDAQEGLALNDVVTFGAVDEVRILLTGKVAQTETIGRAFATSMSLSRDARFAIAKQLLEKEPGVNVRVISHFLAQAVREKDHALLEMLLKYHPDTSYNDSESMVLAAQTGDEKASELLVRGNPPRQTVNRAFEALLDSRAIQKQPGGFNTALILLRLGVQQSLVNRALLDCFDDPVDTLTVRWVDALIPYKPNFSGDNGKAFIIAACCESVQLFERMAMQGPDLNVVVPSLIVCFRSRKEEWFEEWAAREADGAPDMTKNDGAESEVQAKPCNESRRPLQAHVEDDVESVKSEGHPESPSEYDDSQQDTRKSEKQAVNQDESSDVDAFTDERSSTPPPLPTAEERLVFYLQILEACSNRGSNTLDDSVVYVAMTAFPQGRLLVDHLLDNGCSADSKINASIDPSTNLFSHGSTQPESLSPLIWALTYAEEEIGESVIFEIMKRGDGVDVTFESSSGHHTAAMVASAANRLSVLGRLIEMGANISRHDIYEHTALFYASRNGHHDAVEMLQAAGAKVDDGSLHEAAREAFPQIVELLLENGHRRDFSSSLHADQASGRNALEELCRHATPTGDLDDWNARIRKCIDQLLPGSVEDLRRPDGKTIMHLAFENPDPLPITRALLDFSWVWENKNLHHSVHLYRDSHGYFYSLTKYAELLLPVGTLETREQLIALLRTKRCADRFYAHTIEQPEGAVGLPDDVALALDKHNRAEYEHQEAIKRQKDLAARNRAIEQEDYDRRVREDNERHNLLMRQQREQEMEDLRIVKAKADAALSHAQSIAKQQRLALEDQRRLQNAMLEDEAQHRATIRQAQQSSELNHKAALARQELQAVQGRLDLEARIISNKESAGIREQSRLEEMLRKRRETADYEARMRSNGGY